MSLLSNGLELLELGVTAWREIINANFQKVYSKIEIDSKVTTLNSSIDTLNNNKASKATTLAGYGIKNAYTKEEIDIFISSLGTINQPTTVVFGLIWNQTADTYKRIQKNIDTTGMDTNSEFSSWLSTTAIRLNDNDVSSNSTLTSFLNSSADLPFSGIKRYIINNDGTEAQLFNADSYTHTDNAGILSTQQVMVKIPKFHYIQARIVDSGSTYHIYAIANSEFTIDLYNDFGFASPTITVWMIWLH